MTRMKNPFPAMMLQEKTGSWAEETFPQSSNESIREHLKEEFVEFLDNQDPEEAADIVLLLMHHAHKNGYSLLQVAAQKLDKNKLRKWETEPNEKGYCKHKNEVGVMDILDIYIAMDAIGQQLVERGNSPDAIREFLSGEADRVADEIEIEQS